VPSFVVGPGVHSGTIEGNSTNTAKRKATSRQEAESLIFEASRQIASSLPSDPILAARVVDEALRIVNMNAGLRDSCTEIANAFKRGAGSRRRKGK
jgi:hypothetical protein